ncbi:MAG: T9SS type A sorting domain-containing protein [Chitinophagales bacterium]|nr:T9SS type A sorting domain-containing protein [Chitinophagales bacterium]
MKKHILLSVVVALFLFTNFVVAQRCGTAEHLEWQLQQNPLLQQSLDAIEQHTQQYLLQPQPPGERAVITIPVVVHVVYNTSAQNISDQQIFSQINQLNLDFRKLNTDWTSTPSVFQSLVADYEIEFCLATRDPNGNPTTGIIRRQTSATSFSTNNNVKYTANGGSDAWPRASYLNIWVCNLGNSLLGYAQFPGGAAATDGVVITYTAFGTIGTATSPYNKGRTATHEIGHWLNLYHIWGDATCGNDQVNDTPLHNAANYGCPTYPHYSTCTGTPVEMTMNYMDYTNDACMYMFTNGQKARSMALFATGGSRASLLNSQGCLSVNPAPVANFTADKTTSCSGTIQFTDQSTGNPTSWLWNFGDGNTSTQQNPTYTYSANGTYTVTLTVTNGVGSNTKTQTNLITITKPAAPAVNNGSRCGTGTVTLSSSSSDTIKWYASLNATTPLATGNPFVTPSISTTTTYYAEASVSGPTYTVGPANNNIGTGGYLNSSWYTIFNVLKPCTLQSVYVYANGAGNRTFELQNSAGTVLSTLTVNVPNGGSTVTLNFPLTVGTGYRLGLPSNTTINLYRNNAGAVYPYNDAGGNVSITGNNAGSSTTAYFYYCYNWVIKTPDCVSERTPAVATVNPAITLSNPTVNNVACNGLTNGSASVSASGGTPAFTYAWNNGQTTANATNLAAGTYTVTVTDTKSCSATATATIAQPAVITAIPNVINVSCFGGSNGSSGLNVSGGTPSFNYQWSNGQTTPAATNLTAGTYTVTITDVNSCSITASATVTQPNAISATGSGNSISCHGGNNGAIILSVTGGTSPYSYQWSNGSTSANLNGLTAGTYGLTVTDANSCIATFSGTLNEPPALLLTTSSSNAGCNQSTGSASVNATGGTSPYAYSWNTGATSSSLSNIGAGTYTVTVTDNNNCTTTASAIVNSAGSLSAGISGTNVACFGNSTGSASVTINNGMQPITYNWSNGGTTSSITNVPAGIYTVTVTDGNGCSSILTNIISQPAALNLSTSSTDANCGTATGAAQVNVTGGTTGYSYNWSNGATGASISNVAAGNYFVTVTDNNACSSSASVTINNAGSLPVSLSSIPVNCFGNSTGSVTVTVTTGTAPFTYVWSNGAQTASATNLAAGTYTITVSDAIGCSATASQTITQPAALNVSVNATNTLCGTANGSVTALVTGGTSGYSYSWSNGTTSSSVSGLGAGNYVVTVTDNNNCTSTASGIVNATGNLSVNVLSINVACNGGNNGTATVNVVTGNPPYTYNWSTGSQTNVASNLAAGTYIVTVSDNNLCQQIETVVIAEPAPLSVLINETDIPCGAVNTGSASATVTGGTPGYNYQWSNNTTGNSVSGLSAGSYSVVVSDVNHCSVTATFDINEQPEPAANISASNLLCFNDFSGTAVVGVSGGSPAYAYAWNTGAITNNINGVPAGNYSVTITDANNCTTTAAIVITQPSEIQFATSTINANEGQNNGEVSVSNISGGTPPYNLEWSTGETSSNISGLAPGLYSVTVYDGNGCEKTAFVVVNEIPGTGISEAALSLKFSVYPNPATDEVVISVSNYTGASSVQLKNVLGQAVVNHTMNEPVEKLNLANFAEGIYYLEIRNESGSAVKQLLISR